MRKRNDPHDRHPVRRKAPNRDRHTSVTNPQLETPPAGPGAGSCRAQAHGHTPHCPPPTATPKHRPVHLLVPLAVAQEPLSRRFSDFPESGSLALGPVWSGWAPWPCWLEQPVCTAEMPPTQGGAPRVCVHGRCASTWRASSGRAHLPRVLPAQRQRTVPSGEEEPRGPVWELTQQVQLGSHPFRANLCPSWAGPGQRAPHQLELPPASSGPALSRLLCHLL